MSNSLGATIRQARKDAGLSLPALSRLTGLTTGLISQIETGVRSDPRLSTVARIAAGLGVNVEVLVNRARLVESQALRQPQLPQGSRERIALVRALKEVGEELNAMETLLKSARRKLEDAWHRIEGSKDPAQTSRERG